MKSTINTSKVFRENEYDIIFLPMSIAKEIGKIIKQTRIYGDKEELISAVEKFIVAAVKERIQKYPKKKFWLERAIFHLNLSLEKTMFE